MSPSILDTLPIRLPRTLPPSRVASSPFRQSFGLGSRSSARWLARCSSNAHHAPIHRVASPRRRQLCPSPGPSAARIVGSRASSYLSICRSQIYLWPSTENRLPSSSFQPPFFSFSFSPLFPNFVLVLLVLFSTEKKKTVFFSSPSLTAAKIADNSSCGSVSPIDRGCSRFETPTVLFFQARSVTLRHRVSSTLSSATFSPESAIA